MAPTKKEQAVLLTKAQIDNQRKLVKAQVDSQMKALKQAHEQALAKFAKLCAETKELIEKKQKRRGRYKK